MDTDFLVIKENNNIHQIIELMKKSDAYIYPIVGMDEKYIGVTSLGEIRDAFYEEQLDQLILAGDIVREMDSVVYLGQQLNDAMEIFRSRKTDYIPVLKDKDSRLLVGKLEYKRLMDYITKEVLFRQQELEVE
jgi:CBS domain-containing protein